jgi:uncharacterized hydantoinase/oxoprolinase family protein
VCADSETLASAEIRAIAEAIAEAQVEEIAAALRRVAGRLARPAPVVATGLGSFLARRAAQRAGMPVQDLADVLKVDVGTVAPAVAIAWLALDGLRP